MSDLIKLQKMFVNSNIVSDTEHITVKMLDEAYRHSALVTLSITNLDIKCRYAKCRYAKCLSVVGSVAGASGCLTVMVVCCIFCCGLFNLAKPVCER